MLNDTKTPASTYSALLFNASTKDISPNTTSKSDS